MIDAVEDVIWLGLMELLENLFLLLTSSTVLDGTNAKTPKVIRDSLQGKLVSGSDYSLAPTVVMKLFS